MMSIKTLRNIAYDLLLGIVAFWEWERLKTTSLVVTWSIFESATGGKCPAKYEYCWREHRASLAMLTSMLSGRIFASRNTKLRCFAVSTVET